MVTEEEAIDERVVRDDPGRVQVIGYKTEDYNSFYCFEGPMYRGDRRWEHKDLAFLYADVYWDVGGFREEKTGKRGVPPAIAAAGRDTLAAYLLTQRGVSSDWLTGFFDVEPETISTYLSRVRARAEKAREEYSEDDAEDDDL